MRCGSDLRRCIDASSVAVGPARARVPFCAVACDCWSLSPVSASHHGSPPTSPYLTRTHARARAHTHTGTRLRAHWASHFAAALAPDPAIGAASLGRVRRAPPRRSRRARRCTARLRLRARALVLRGLALRPLVRAEFGLSAPLSESYAARSAATSAHAGVCVILIVTV